MADHHNVPCMVCQRIIVPPPPFFLACTSHCDSAMRQRAARLSLHAPSYLAAPRYSDRNELLRGWALAAGAAEPRIPRGGPTMAREPPGASCGLTCFGTSRVRPLVHSVSGARAQLVPGAIACTKCLKKLRDPKSWTRNTSTGRIEECAWWASLAPRSSVPSAVAATVRRVGVPTRGYHLLDPSIAVSSSSATESASRANPAPSSSASIALIGTLADRRSTR
jgi:hypothetical protein